LILQNSGIIRRKRDDTREEREEERERKEIIRETKHSISLHIARQLSPQYLIPECSISVMNL